MYIRDCNRRKVRDFLVAVVLSLVAVCATNGTGQAQTKYRLPLAYVPYSINAWMDHWHTPYATNTNIRYDGTIILPGSPYYYGISPRHRGTDFGVPVGTLVYAAASGTVAFVQTGCAVGNLTCGDGFGNYVAIQHADGWYSIYAHLSSVNVSVGQSITCVSGPGGALIGYSGNTGDSTGRTCTSSSATDY